MKCRKVGRDVLFASEQLVRKSKIALIVANYITNTYLLEIAKQSNNNELLETIITYRDNSLGEVAIDFPIKISKNGKITDTSLHKLDSADHYLIIFWSSTCFHCLDELPKVKAFIEAQLDGVIEVTERTKNARSRIRFIGYQNRKKG